MSARDDGYKPHRVANARFGSKSPTMLKTMGTSPTAKDDGYEPHRNEQKTHDSGLIPDAAETMGISPTALPKVSDSGLNP